LLAWALILNENVVVTIILLPLLCVPLLLLASLCVRKALIACAAALAYAYFCQQGLIYIERRRRVVLRWEEIEQTEVQYTFWLRRCLVTLGNGQAAMLLNSVGGNLSGQIRRRLLRFRKKHQHSERFHSPPHFQDWLS
jgi:hypothetical protein